MASCKIWGWCENNGINNGFIYLGMVSLWAGERCWGGGLRTPWLRHGGGDGVQTDNSTVRTTRPSDNSIVSNSSIYQLDVSLNRRAVWRMSCPRDGLSELLSCLTDELSDIRGDKHFSANNPVPVQSSWPMSITVISYIFTIIMRDKGKCLRVANYYEQKLLS